jgi:hypothetical protein
MADAFEVTARMLGVSDMARYDGKVGRYVPSATELRTHAIAGCEMPTGGGYGAMDEKARN